MKLKDYNKILSDVINEYREVLEIVTIHKEPYFDHGKEKVIRSKITNNKILIRFGTYNKVRIFDMTESKLKMIEAKNQEELEKILLEKLILFDTKPENL